MPRFVRAIAFLLCCAPHLIAADDSSDQSSPIQDLKAIRQTLDQQSKEMDQQSQALDQQSKQIDVLAQEIARLNLLLEARTPTASGLAPSPADTQSTSPASASAPPVALQAGTADVPDVTSTSPNSGRVHIVSKGETLTAIAKRYKVTVPEILKVNKIADVRKLQIGESLALPPNAKVPESASASPTP